MQGLTIECWYAQSFGQFFEVLLKKRRVLSASESWARFHFFSEGLPFHSGPSLTAMVEEDEGVTAVVILPIRQVFEEEHDLREWEHARWFFTAWRRMLHDGQLVKVLNYFFNKLDGEFSRVPSLLTSLRADIVEGARAVEFEADGARLAVDGDEMDARQMKLRQGVEAIHANSRRVLWCKLLYVIERYLEHGQETDVDDDD